MSSSQDQTILSNEENEVLLAKKLVGSLTLPMVLKTVIELHVFEIMAKAGHELSSSEICSYLPTKNPRAPIMLERMLRLLASNSILTYTNEGGEVGGKRVYGLASLGKHFVGDEHGVSLAPSLLFLQHKAFIDAWGKLKEVVLEGGIPFNRAHGMHVFEYSAKEKNFNESLNKAMYSRTIMDMEMVLEHYKGFEGANVVVDVGGGFGATLKIILAKYPSIKGINFDLPHVVKDAPLFPGVEHVGGDMFESVPKGEVIFMKWILHDWSDEQCLKVLKNCWNALPNSGKVIVMEEILPEHPDANPLSESVIRMDVAMLVFSNGGKERTRREYEALARGSGFTTTRFDSCSPAFMIMEFHKTE